MRANSPQTTTTDPVTGVVGQLQSEIDAQSDPRQAYRKVREAIADFNRRGKVPPRELITLERNLALDCIQASQGR